VSCAGVRELPPNFIERREDNDSLGFRRCCSYDCFDGKYVADPGSGTATKAPSLYTQWGEYDAIAAVRDDFITRLATDPSLAKFFARLNDTSKQGVRQHVIDSLCNAPGGPCLYLGKT
jgi:hypothetical protein